MGGTYTLLFSAPVKATDAPAMFWGLDVEGREYPTIKALMPTMPARSMMPKSLRALYFSNNEKIVTLALTKSSH